MLAKNVDIIIIISYKCMLYPPRVPGAVLMDTLFLQSVKIIAYS